MYGKAGDQTTDCWLVDDPHCLLSHKHPAVCCKEVGLFLQYNETLLCLKDKKYHPKRKEKKVLPDALARLVAVTTAAVVCLPFWVMGRTGSWCKPGVRLRASPACTALSTVWITRSLVSWASEDKAYDSNMGTRQQSSQIWLHWVVLSRLHRNTNAVIKHLSEFSIIS